MIVRDHIRPLIFVGHYWKSLALMTAYSGAFLAADRFTEVDVTLPIGVAAMLGTAISILLAFMVNAAYDRWWEARKIWGGIVNDSRSFARQVLTLLVAPAGEEAAVREMQQELVHRHIGWCSALGHVLRGEDPLPSLAGLVSGEEASALAQQDNVPNALLQTQGEWVADARGRGYVDSTLSFVLEKTLVRFSDHQGMAERIKTTKFATPFTYIVSRALFLFFLLLPAGLVEHLGWLAIPVSVLVATFFSMIEHLSANLQDPFENRSTDTPMTAISRTIEINLRQQLGETSVPPKLEPVDGVLL